MKFKEFESLGFVEHCFTTRIGGCSKDSYHSLNMGMNVPEEVKNTIENIDKVCKIVFNKTKNDVIMSDQIHDIKIKKVNESDKGKGIVKERDFEEVDGLVTNVPGIILMTSYADCTPLFIIDEKKKVIASVHSGWKGTVGKIGAEAVKVMVNDYGSNLKDIKVGIGPTIGPESFEVGEEVYIEFKNKFENMEKILSERRGEKYFLNLWEANREVFINAGISAENIFIDNHDTYLNEDLFYSYRRDKGVTGRMSAMIMLK